MNRLIFTSLFFVFSVKISVGQLTPALDTRLQFVLDSVCNKHRIKGASAAVLLPGAGVWKGVHGVSEASQPLAPDMLFGIGSNTKTYIATLLLQLQEDGILDLDDPIGNWIDPHPYIDSQITIRQLLNHKSGLYNYTNSIPLNNAIGMDFTAIWTPEDILPYIEAPLFTPGSNWSYCNTNYLLAGLILKEVYNQPLSLILRDKILDPHGLINTALFPEEVPLLPMANIWTTGFSNNFLEEVITDYGYNHNAVFSMAWAAGGIVATAEDNVRFFDKLMTGQLINTASLNEMKTVYPISISRGYGLGLFQTTNYNGRTVYGHGGTNLGYINENVYDPLNGACISALTNQDSVSNSIILNRLVSAMHRAVLANPLDVSGLTHSSCEVFPNPVTDHITIKGLSGNTELALYDITGKKVKSGKSDLERYTISLADLQAGLYMVEVSSVARGGKEVRKVVIR